MSQPTQRLRTACLVLAGALAGSALAQSAPQDASSAWVDESRLWLENSVAASRPLGATALRMEVSVGNLDKRLALAPCAQVEPYIPAGMRLWGRTRLGLRCADGNARWNVFLPVVVRAFGQAWVLREDVAMGAVLNEDNAVQAEVDWAQESGTVLGDPAMWLGQTATRKLGAGQALRQGMVRPAQVFQAGATVRIVAQGKGFAVTSDAQALSAGVIGAPARVRIDNGRVLTGVVLDAQTVRIDL